MAPFDLPRRMVHPYVDLFPETHGHFAPTQFVQPAYSAACIPYRWMLREEVEGNPKNGQTGISQQLKLGWVPDKEPDIRDRNGRRVETDWVQAGENQVVLLDTFFGALRREESLCFFYAKRTPLSDQGKRVILGVGRVISVQPEAKEYEFSPGIKSPPLRCVLWERNVGHSIRPGFSDGFLFPYREVLELADREGLDPEEFVAFAPDEYHAAYSYGSEHLTHDGAVASLLACITALHRIRERIEGPWDQVLGWIDSQLNRLWRARGPYPGLGSALSAFGYEWGLQNGSLIAYAIDGLRERDPTADPWELLNAAMDNPAILGSLLGSQLTDGLRGGWKRLPAERRSLLHLLSRCAIKAEQALRIYDPTKRNDAGIEATDTQLLANPYLLFERDRSAKEAIDFGTVDRGLFPDPAIQLSFPVPKPSLVEDPADWRRVRGLVVDLLEAAASQGHTLLPRTWVIRRARERTLQPPCPLGENVLDASEQSFDSVVQRGATRAGEPAYQLDHLAECRAIIRREVLGRKQAKQHASDQNWRRLVDNGLAQALPHDPAERRLEERARTEKAAALEQLFRSRLSVLVGPAGTGKTTLLRMLCSLEEVISGGLLLLAPTGKARVRLEEQTRQRGQGFTVAQFLTRRQRYDYETGAYFPNRKAPKCADYRTVIVDECSMLTEQQLAALIDSLRGVERLILVGDPRQLPPIGAGRPFVDIVSELAPTNIETVFPRTGLGYAELTITRRQKGEALIDVLLASHFSGRPLDPGADEVWDLLSSGSSERLRLVEWNHPQELSEKLIDELARGLGLTGPDDELGFEESLGGERYGDMPWAFFWNKFGDKPGAASKAEAWQVLSPVRSGLVGVDALNRMLQERFRRQVRRLAHEEPWRRKVTRPIGPQNLLYGDKVINLVNQRRRDVWPEPAGEAFLANGDIGMIVGQYKTQRLKGVPYKLEVEFAGQLGPKYGFGGWEFGDEGQNPLELAYCLTVHKTQGSEFGVTFVVLTNPCWLLSRELLYTALTRHQDRLVILHQGPLGDYRHYSGEEQSEIARRMTNLFVDPLPRAISVAGQQRFLEDRLIHRTERGELVQSKSELVIADKLFARGIDYAYERPLLLPDGHTRYPDFTISDDARGVTFYWEHLGLLDDPGYKRRWEKKRAEYQKAGIISWEDGGGTNGTLIESRDQPGGALDASVIAGLIDKLLV